MQKRDSAELNEWFKTLSRAYKILKYYVEKISFEHWISKNDVGNIQIHISLLYSSDISDEEGMEIERFRKSQSNEMRKHREKQIYCMKRDMEVRDGQSVTAESEEHYNLFDSQCSAPKKAPEELVRGMVDTTKHSTSVPTERKTFHPPQCKEEDKFSPPCPSDDNDANPQQKSSKENRTAHDILQSQVLATANQSGQHFNNDNIKVKDEWTIKENEMTRFLNYVRPSMKPKMTFFLIHELRTTLQMPIPNKTYENKSKRESMEVIVIDEDDKVIQTHSNSDASYSNGPDVKADATTAKRECKKSPNTSWSPAIIQLEKKREDYWTNMSIRTVKREVPPGTHVYLDCLLAHIPG